MTNTDKDKDTNHDEQTEQLGTNCAGDGEMFYLSPRYLQYKSTDLPFFEITIHGVTYKMLADTGATDSSLRTTSDDFQMSTKTKTCIGVTGTPITCTVTKPCPVECEDFGVSALQHSFVIVPECPVNLAGRDLLCALGLTIVCTEEGLVLKKSNPVDSLSTNMVFHTPGSPVYTYCWEVDQNPVSRRLHDFVKSHASGSLVKHDPHTYRCVAHETQDSMGEQFDDDWNLHTEKEGLCGKSIMVAEDFVVLLVELTEKQRRVYGRLGAPHIVLAKSQTILDQDIDMLLLNPDDVRGATIHPFPCLLGTYRAVQLESDPFLLSTMMDIHECEKHPALKGVQKELWATHKYDVGLIRDSTPLVVVP